MKKKPKSIRIAEWNKTMKFLTSKIDSANKLINASEGSIESEAFDSLLADLKYWENQRSAHISVKPI